MPAPIGWMEEGEFERDEDGGGNSRKCGVTGDLSVQTMCDCKEQASKVTVA